jgi:hypothetical protein
MNLPGHLTGRLRIDRVTFRYRADGPLILNEVSIERSRGVMRWSDRRERKSVVNLLPRPGPPAAELCFDDHDLKGLDILSVRQQMGVVSQENKILAGRSTTSRPAFRPPTIRCGRRRVTQHRGRSADDGAAHVRLRGRRIQAGSRSAIDARPARKPALMISTRRPAADNKAHACDQSLNRLKATHPDRVDEPFVTIDLRRKRTRRPDRDLRFADEREGVVRPPHAPSGRVNREPRTQTA